MEEMRMRTSLIGFNKRDVYKYISELSERNASKLAIKDAESSELRSGLYSIKQDYDKLKTESTIDIEKMSIALNSKGKELDFYSTRLSTIETDLNTVISVKDDEINKLRKELEGIKTAFEAIKTSGVEDFEGLKQMIDVKSKEVERVNQKLFILQAERESLVGDKEAEIEKLTKEVNLLRENYEKIKRESQQEIEQLKNSFEERNNEIDDSSERLKLLENQRESVFATMALAENEAKKIIDQAKLQADSVLFQLDSQIMEKRMEMDTLTQEIRMLRNQLARISQSFTTQIDDVVREHVVDNFNK